MIIRSYIEYVLTRENVSKLLRVCQWQISKTKTKIKIKILLTDAKSVVPLNCFKDIRRDSRKWSLKIQYLRACTRVGLEIMVLPASQCQIWSSDICNGCTHPGGGCGDWPWWFAVYWVRLELRGSIAALHLIVLSAPLEVPLEGNGSVAAWTAARINMAKNLTWNMFEWKKVIVTLAIYPKVKNREKGVSTSLKKVTHG